MFIGNNIDDDKVPSIITFSKMLFSAILALDVIFIFSCILMLAGIATTRYYIRKGKAQQQRQRHNGKVQKAKAQQQSPKAYRQKPKSKKVQ